MNEYMKRIEDMANYVDGVPGTSITKVIRGRILLRREKRE